MTDEVATVPEETARVQSEEETTFNKGSYLFRLYPVDADTNPDEPIIKLLFKRGDDYTDVQKRARAYFNGSAPNGDYVYEDEECTRPFDLGPEGEHSWFLALTRKQKAATRPAGVDKEWLRILMAREDLSAEQKLAEIAKFT